MDPFSTDKWTQIELTNTKYRPKYPFKGFSSLDEARKWVAKFVRWYNTEHLHSGIKFLTPYQRHYNLDQAIMAKRTQTYQLAKAKHPERWSGGVRDWSLPDYVCLNPMSETEVKNFINTKNDGFDKISLKQV